MTRFLDGIAKNSFLHLQRSPIYLRVTFAVVDQKPFIDALDLIEDYPSAEEKLSAYKLVSNDGFVHVDGRDPKINKRFGRTEAISTYKLCAEQPSDEVMRDNKRWQEWCLSQKSVE